MERTLAKHRKSAAKAAGDGDPREGKREKELALAPDETVILLHPPSTSTLSWCISSDGERASAKSQPRQWLERAPDETVILLTLSRHHH